MNKIILMLLATVTILLSEGSHSHDKHEFEPVVTLITDFLYVQRNKEIHEIFIPGFTHVDANVNDGHSHSEPNSNEGFNFNSAELEIEASIDEKFELRSAFHLSDDLFEIEELYLTTHKRDGINFKAGKFLSNFGENNSKHPEKWDFSQQPLINNALFGIHGLNEKGLAVSWNNKNFKVGIELLTGENEMTFGNSEIEDKNISIEGSDNPEVNIVYLEYKKRFGRILVEGGLSLARGKARWDHTGENNSHVLTGDVTLNAMNTSIIFPFSRVSNLRWSNEYIQRKIKNGIRHDSLALEVKNMRMDQYGLNTSFIYTVNSNWKTGLRYEDILKNDKIVNNSNTNQSNDLKRISFMIEHYLSENNRIRMQYVKDDSKFHDDELISYNEIILQWTFSFSTGKHKH